MHTTFLYFLFCYYLIFYSMNIWSTNRYILTPFLLGNVSECSCSIWPISSVLSILTSFTLFHFTNSCTHCAHTHQVQMSDCLYILSTDIYVQTWFGKYIIGHDTSISTIHRNTRMCNTLVTNPWPNFLILGAMSRITIHEHKCVPCLRIKPKTASKHDFIHTYNFSYNSLFCCCLLFYAMNIWSTNRYFLTMMDQWVWVSMGN